MGKKKYFVSIVLLTFILLVEIVCFNNKINICNIKIGNDLVVFNRKLSWNTKLSLKSKIILQLSHYCNIHFLSNNKNEVKEIILKRPKLLIPRINDNLLSLDIYAISWNTKKTDFINLINKDNMPYEFQEENVISNKYMASIYDIKQNDSIYMDPYSREVKLFKKGEDNLIPKNWKLIYLQKNIGTSSYTFPIRDPRVFFHFDDEILTRVEITIGNE